MKIGARAGARATGLRALARRLIAFLAGLSVAATAVALALCILFALQAKRPLELEIAAGSPAESAEQSRVVLRPPIYSYGGPVILRIECGPVSAAATLRVQRSGRTVAFGYLPAGSEGGGGSGGGEKRFLLYGGALSGGLPIELQVGPAGDGTVRAAALEFPKAGHWLIPDPLVWIGLVLTGLVLGAAAALVWSPPAPARACYAAFSVVLVLAIYFWGLGFAARLARLLPAAALLLVVVAVVRLLIRPIQHQKAKSDQAPDERRD